MRWLIFTCFLSIWTSLLAEPDWVAMDERFNRLFLSLQDRPIELQSLAREELFAALEAADCEAALVAHSLLIRSAMLLQFPPDAAEWELTLPAGCRADYPRLNYDMGCRLMQAGRPEEAERQFRLAAKAPKWASHAWNMVGLMLHNAGDLAGAAAAWERAHDAVEGPPNPSVLINLGLVCSEQGDWRAALLWFQLAHEAQKWNEETKAYTFLEDIEPMILLNLLRSAVNTGDSVVADQTWAQLRPNQLTADPVRQLRPLLDYALWRNRPDLIEGLVRVYAPHVERDSLHAVDHLNDRVLLFDPWRSAVGWDLDRSMGVLVRAESDPAMRRVVFSVDRLPKKTRVSASGVRWVSLVVWGIIGLCSLGAAWFAWRWQRLRAAKHRLGDLNDADFFAELKAVLYAGDRHPHRQVVVAGLARRLDQKSGIGKLTEQQLSRLNAQETKVLERVLSHHSSSQIAEELSVTVQRIYNIRSSIRTKLGLESGQAWDDLKNSPND